MLAALQGLLQLRWTAGPPQQAASTSTVQAAAEAAASQAVGTPRSAAPGEQPKADPYDPAPRARYLSWEEYFMAGACTWQVVTARPAAPPTLQACLQWPSSAPSGARTPTSRQERRLPSCCPAHEGPGAPCTPPAGWRVHRVQGQRHPRHRLQRVPAGLLRHGAALGQAGQGRGRAADQVVRTHVRHARLHTYVPAPGGLTGQRACSPYVCHAELNAVLNKNSASLQGAVRGARGGPLCTPARG